MTDLECILRSRVAAREKLLSPFVTAGFPDLDSTVAVLEAIDSLGVGCIEIGIPFSDPVADGPTIQASFASALSGGVTVRKIFDSLGAASSRLATPRVAMVSYTIAAWWGVERFLSSARDAGFAGVLFPDLPLGAEPAVGEQADRLGLANILLAAPTSGPDRRRRIAAASTGYVYYLSVAGITGERAELPPDLPANVAELKSAAGGKPVFVGFGISRPEHVAQVVASADGAIVGSAIVRRIADAVEERLPRPQLAQRVADYVAELSSGLRPQATV